MHKIIQRCRRMRLDTLGAFSYGALWVKTSNISVNNNTNFKIFWILSIYTIWDGLSLKTISRYCPFNVNILASTSVPFRLTAVQVTTIAKMPQTTVYNNKALAYFKALGLHRYGQDIARMPRVNPGPKMSWALRGPRRLPQGFSWELPDKVSGSFPQ